MAGLARCQCVKCRATEVRMGWPRSKRVATQEDMLCDFCRKWHRPGDEDPLGPLMEWLREGEEGSP